MPDIYLPIYAAFLGAALLIIQILLMLSVGTYRAKSGTSIGVKDDTVLERRVRRHGNLAENAAIFVVVLALYEIMFGQTFLALSLAVVFFVARILHMSGFGSAAGSHLIGVEDGGRPFVLMRMAGAMLTALTSLVLGVSLIVSLAFFG